MRGMHKRRKAIPVGRPAFHILIMGARHILYAPQLALFMQLFLLRDKRVALFGFVGLAVVLVMFYFAAWMLDTDQRATMVQLITLYGVAPALIGNAVAWPVYLKLRKTHPLPVQKTLQEEMREAAGTKADAAPKAHPAAPAAEERPRRSPQEDAMLLFEDGEDAGCHRRRNTHGKDEDS